MSSHSLLKSELLSVSLLSDETLQDVAAVCLSSLILRRSPLDCFGTSFCSWDQACLVTQGHCTPCALPGMPTIQTAAGQQPFVLQVSGQVSFPWTSCHFLSSSLSLHSVNFHYRTYYTLRSPYILVSLLTVYFLSSACSSVKGRT